MKIKGFLLLLIFISDFTYSQTDSLSIFKKRKILFCSTAGLTSASSLVALNQLWYSDYPRSTFHFFDDKNEWLQMDKVGHFYSTYQLGRFAYRSMKWAGFSDNKSIFLGGMYGSGYLLLVEVLDGFSDQWGFSSTDLLANMGGSLLFVSQQYYWQDQKISLKYSFHKTNYPTYRPEILGKSFTQQIFKDYNGQSYWLSFNIKSIFQLNEKFPSWINLALGYSAEGMISAKNNYVFLSSSGDQIGLNPYRKYYLSFDVDFARIKTKSKIMKAVFSVFNSVKVPFPSLEFSDGKVIAHPFFH